MASSASRRKLKSRLFLSLHLQPVPGKDTVMKITDRGGGDGVEVNYNVGVFCVRACEIVAKLPKEARFVLNACTRASFSQRRRRDLFEGLKLIIK